MESENQIAAGNASPHARRKMTRLLWLHVAVSPLALLVLLVMKPFAPSHNQMVVVGLVLNSIGTAQLMLLGFYASMGSGALAGRIARVCVGAALIYSWQLCESAAVSGPPLAQLASGCLLFDLSCLGSVAVVFAAFVRWWAKLNRSIPDKNLDQSRFQFSTSYLLIATACVAAFLGARQLSDDLAVSFLIYAVFLGIAPAAVWAALAGGAALPRAILVLATAAGFGYALGMQTHHDEGEWAYVPTATALIFVPTAVMIASLLVVRSCGYRLVPMTYFLKANKTQLKRLEDAKANEVAL